jgi:osmotically-inducible protein OsmY
MNRFVPKCLMGVVALCALQACERPGPENSSASLRSAPAHAPVAAAAPEAETATARRVGRPLPGPEDLSDSVITARTKASLVTDPALAGSDISVNTDRGVVNLAGSVRSHEQLALAAAHAQGQDGVMRIESHLTVLSP